VTTRTVGVFLNVPFDRPYRKLFRALVFTVHECGFIARCALEEDDSSRVRVEKLYTIIRQCPLGTHDLARVTLDSVNRLPRFNMPLELGMFLGAKRYGDATQRSKSCLVLELPTPVSEVLLRPRRPGRQVSRQHSESRDQSDSKLAAERAPSTPYARSQSHRNTVSRVPVGIPEHRPPTAHRPIRPAVCRFSHDRRRMAGPKRVAENSTEPELPLHQRPSGRGPNPIRKRRRDSLEMPLVPRVYDRGPRNRRAPEDERVVDERAHEPT
jgi:hypothetical protein